MTDPTDLTSRRAAWTAPELKQLDVNRTALGATYNRSDGQFASASTPGSVF